MVAILNSPTSPIFFMLDNQPNRSPGFECEAGRYLAASGLMQLGIARADLFYLKDEGCAAAPSTDTNGGPGYYSNCLDVEVPVDIPPENGFITEGESGVDITNVFSTPADGWMLRFSGGPSENFFKIYDPSDGNWYYISVVDVHGPILGSAVPGSELDKRARYLLMREIVGVDEDGSQFWLDTVYPAHGLPPRQGE